MLSARPARSSDHRRDVVAEIVVAVDQDRPVRSADDLGERFVAELGQRQVDRARDMAGGELPLRPRVEDQDVGLGGAATKACQSISRVWR